jgi:hypothetical protein
MRPRLSGRVRHPCWQAGGSFQALIMVLSPCFRAGRDAGYGCWWEVTAAVVAVRFSCQHRGRPGNAPLESWLRLVWEGEPERDDRANGGNSSPLAFLDH